MFILFIFNWRIIGLQYCVAFCNQSVFREQLVRHLGSIVQTSLHNIFIEVAGEREMVNVSPAVGRC